VEEEEEEEKEEEEPYALLALSLLYNMMVYPALVKDHLAHHLERLLENVFKTEEEERGKKEIGEEVSCVTCYAIREKAKAILTVVLGM